MRRDASGPTPPRPTPDGRARIPAPSSGRRRGPHSGPPSFPPPLPPVVPAAPEPRESAATAQVPAAGRPRPTGRSRAAAGARRAPAGAGFRYARSPSLLPPASGSWPLPAQLGRNVGSGVGGGRQLRAASRERPPWQPPGSSCARLRPRFLQSRR